jgi:hypothetical protein
LDLDHLTTFENNPRYLVSADLGQAQDFTAVAVLERNVVAAAGREPEEVRGAGLVVEGVRVPVEQYYTVLRLQRIPLRTSYEAISRGIVRLVDEYHRRHRAALEETGAFSVGIQHPADANRNPVRLGVAFDATGVGVAFRDLLIKEIRESRRIQPRRPAIAWLPITITGGTKPSANGSTFGIPKIDVVGAAVAALQTERLKIRDIRDKDTLISELLNFRMRQNTTTGHLSFEARREGDHDDLVLATALGVLAFQKLIKPVKYVHMPAAVLGSA